MRFAEYRRFGVAAMLAGLVAVAGCDDDPVDPNEPSNFGEVGVNVTTTGYAPDFAEGYEVGLEGGGMVEVDVDDEAVLFGAPAGSNTVVLEGVPEHCTVTPSETVTVDVNVGDRTEVDFTVACEAITGGITPALTVTGAAEDLDPEIALLVVEVIDAETSDTTEYLLDPANPEELLHFTAGPRTIVFDVESLAANCTVSEPLEIEVEVTLGTTVQAPFSVDCTPNIGDLTINITTTGTNLDASYTLTVGNREPLTVGPNDTVELTDVRVGAVGAVLGDIAANCTATGEQAGGDAELNTVVEFGAATPATLDFTVVCE